MCIRDRYSGDFYVCDVYFSNLGDDGVIVLESSDVKSLISTCTFQNSSRKGDGGSIYIIKGQSSIRKVCSFGSKATGDGSFCRVEISDVSTNVNELHDSSITYGNQESLVGRLTVYITYGNISFFHDNITRNYANGSAAFGVSSGYATSIKYSLINENSAESGICYIGLKPTKINNIIFTNNIVFLLEK